MVEVLDQQEKGKDLSNQGMMPLIRELLRPYRGSLAVILVAMLVQSTMTCGSTGRSKSSLTT